MRRRMAFAFACALLAMATVISGTTALAAATAASRPRNPRCSPRSWPASRSTPLLTVGDVLPGGYRFEAIPDGISVRPVGMGKVDLFVNHETSKVPFPYLLGADGNGSRPVTERLRQRAGEPADPERRRARGLRLVRHPDSGGGFQRFCSNYLATSKEGFDQDIFFTNEESPDYVFRRENSWPPPVGDPAEEENGVVLALDVTSTGSTHDAIYGMGRHNHENDVAIPGFDDLVVFSGDDTFTSGPSTGRDVPCRG